MQDKLFVMGQHLAPQRALSRMAGRLADNPNLPGLKNRMIQWFIHRYGVDMNEALEPDPAAYNSFNDFFTRALKPGLRPVDPDTTVLTSPVDGAVSQLGTVEDGRVFQAKGQWFSLPELLGAPDDEGAVFRNGAFATLYLAPHDYHRIHMPLSGRLTAMTHIPGQLFSVNPVTARHVPNLFARNERVVAQFDTDWGPMALILVGAMIVGSVETTWSGVVAPGARNVTHASYDRNEAPVFDKGDEMGRFRLGSTVILLLPESTVDWEPSLGEESIVRMGQPMGRAQ
ncbi:phosphatidylserine decarboxylase [Tamilnaduibacter salinus]|uniref:Phosphatidylserine decarboxylase proenzyme n=1 Tax=Tamilnaduibacter salinus TaxID=1484056 RepID=A0A2A2I5R1_9GAMM|nr:archaetidylserine decarboxylase [Tamilnaduibacter salinus]PAV26460.1 phosphatidylserine decarboxylase [Tamilnaduibacter salinus]PVY70692.1 phosphatidylserine decarboxylase [Tamilnaduibacter salinus]